MSKAWQHPYVNVFKHFKIEEWKKSTKEGDVTTFMDKTLKCTVYRIRGPVPASNYILLPKTSTQSLGLTGRYLYLLFKPIPDKHFVVHLDVATEDGQVIRISFSNLFKEFKSTATWLQFPFLCGAAKGSVYESTARTARQGKDLVGPAPASVRWICLMMDLQYVLSMYLNRRYSHLKSIKLCASMLLKNLFTSDLLIDPGLTFIEAKQAGAVMQGSGPMPREMCFPVPKGGSWHDLYDYIRFPSDGGKMPFDSIQKGQATAGPTHSNVVRELPRNVNLSKPVQDRVSLIQQITSPKPVRSMPAASQKASPGQSLLNSADYQPQTTGPTHSNVVRELPRNVNLSKPVQDRVSLIQQITSPKPSRSLHDSWQAEALESDRKEDPGASGDSVALLTADDGGIHVFAHRDEEISVHRHKSSTEERPRRRTPLLAASVPELPPVSSASQSRSLHDSWQAEALESDRKEDPGASGDSVALLTADDGGIHVFAHRDEEISVHRHKSSTEETVCTRVTGPVSLPAKKVAEHTKLQPDPILKLNRIIGFGGCTTKCTLWTKTGTAVVYPCHAVIVSMDIASGQQRFFIGHTDKVSALTFNGNCTLLASAQTGNLSVVRVWNYQKGSCLSLFKTHTHSVSSLSFSYSGGVLCGVGKDNHGKTMVVVWNTLKANKGGEVVVMAKAHTDVDIQTMKIAFFDDTRMVSCGRDNIRLWRVRSGSLRSCPVNLAEYHAVEFTDIAFEQGHFADREPEDRTLKAECLCSLGQMVVVWNTLKANKGGEVVVMAKAHTDVDIQTMKIAFFDDTRMVSCGRDNIRLWRVRSGSLRSCPVNLAEYHAVEFTDIAFEQGHFADREPEDRTLLVNIGPEGAHVLAATSTGNLGYLDVSSRAYSTLMRSHTDTVLGFSIDGIRRNIVTVSLDNSVRVWDIDSMQQLFDFISEDTPCAVAFHPVQQVFACGFSSGLVRVFNIASSSLLAEHKQHRGQVIGLTFSPDGENMYSAGSLGSLALYNSVEEDHHILRVLGNVVARGSERSPEALTVSSDSRSLAFVGPAEYTVTVMDARSLDEVCFAPVATGHLLVTTSSNKILWMNAKSGRLIREIPNAHKHVCSSVSVTDDARFLLTAGDKAVKVWDYHMKHDINFQVFIGHSQPVQQVTFTPDQLGVVTAGDAVYIWDFLANPHEPQESREVPAPAPAVTQSPFKSDVLHEEEEEQEKEREKTLVRPDAYKHFTPRFRTSALAQDAVAPPAGEESLRLKAVIGYNGNGRGNMVWNPDTGLFAYSCGSVVVLEDLHAGSQKHWVGHTEEISTLAVTNDAQTVASASGGSDGTSSLICIWNVKDGSRRSTISYHKGAVQAMTYSRDDFFLLSAGDYRDPAIALWSTNSYQLLTSIRLAEPIHDLSFNPASASQLACVGSGGVMFCLIEQQGKDARLKERTNYCVSMTVKSALKYKRFPSVAAGQVVLSGGKDGLMAVSSPRTGMTIRIISDHKGASISCIQCTKKQYNEFGLEGSEMWLAASSDRRVSIWAADWMKDKCELIDWLSFPAPALDDEIIRKIALSHWATCLSLSPRGQLITVGCNERLIKLIKSRNGKFQDFTAHSDVVHVCRFTPSGKLLFTSAYNEILLWEVRGL
ncbi:UNVERIFIED_CONTAM: hypothetical protein FKN15_033205 [Acipenser sinensis]